MAIKVKITRRSLLINLTLEEEKTYQVDIQARFFYAFFQFSDITLRKRTDKPNREILATNAADVWSNFRKWAETKPFLHPLVVQSINSVNGKGRLFFLYEYWRFGVDNFQERVMESFLASGQLLIFITQH